MGKRKNKSFFILKNIKRYKYWIASIILGILLVEVAISFIEYKQQEQVWKAIETIIRDEVNMSNSYQLSRKLLDMEKVGWIKCVILYEVASTQRVFYDSSTDSYCGFLNRATVRNLTSINGATWKLSFVQSPSIWLFVTRVLSSFIIIAAHLALYIFLDRNRKKHSTLLLKKELERTYLLDIANQAKHDVASPVMALKMILSRMPEGEQYKEILGEVTKRIEAIVSHLSNSKKFDIYDLKRVNLKNILPHIVTEKSLEWQIPSSSFILEDVNFEVIADTEMLKRIISNLLNNAIEASLSTHNLKIVISAEVFSKGVLILIQDNGVGISAENITKLGRKGFTFGKENTPHSGSGLGIYSSMEAVNSWGGSISFESKIDFGTTVKIYLCS